MELTRTEQMLLQAIRAALRAEQTDWKKVSAEDWNALMTLSAQHKLLPLVFDACYGCPAAEQWTEREKFRKLAKQTIVLQTVKTATFETLYRAFLQQQLRPLVVKGILCRDLYPNGELRQSADEDLYASGNTFCACKELLQAQGYLPTSEADDADELSWNKADGTFHLELHRSLFGKKSAAAERLENLFSNADCSITRYDVSGTEFFSLSPHDHLLYLVLHAYKHFIRSGFGIRQICDIGLWAQRYHDSIDWDKLYVQCESVCALKFAAAALQIAQKELQIDFPLSEPWTKACDSYEPLLCDVLAAGIYGNTDPNRAHSASITQNAVSAKRENRRESVLQTVFPPRKDLVKENPVLKKYGVLLPAVWFKRLLRYSREAQVNDREDPGAALRIAKERKKLLKFYDIL